MLNENVKKKKQQGLKPKLKGLTGVSVKLWNFKTSTAGMTPWEGAVVEPQASPVHQLQI